MIKTIKMVILMSLRIIRHATLPELSRERTPPPRGHAHLSVGDFVRIHGLMKRTDLNGVCGTIIDFVADVNRYAVKLVNTECVRINESNLELLQREV